MPKNNQLTFTVDFDALRVYSNDDATKSGEIQDVFAQSVIYTESVFEAIHRLTFEIQTIDDNGKIDTIRSCENLAVIGKVFLGKIQEQFDELLTVADSALKRPTIKSVESGKLLDELKEFINDFSLLDAETQKVAFRAFAFFWEEFKETEVKKSEQ